MRSSFEHEYLLATNDRTTWKLVSSPANMHFQGSKLAKVCIQWGEITPAQTRNYITYIFFSEATRAALVIVLLLFDWLPKQNSRVKIQEKSVTRMRARKPTYLSHTLLSSRHNNYELRNKWIQINVVSGTCFPTKDLIFTPSEPPAFNGHLINYTVADKVQWYNVLLFPHELLGLVQTDMLAH